MIRTLKASVHRWHVLVMTFLVCLLALGCSSGGSGAGGDGDSFDFGCIEIRGAKVDVSRNCLLPSAIADSCGEPVLCDLHPGGNWHPSYLNSPSGECWCVFNECHYPLSWLSTGPNETSSSCENLTSKLEPLYTCERLDALEAEEAESDGGDADSDEIWETETESGEEL